jgi:murein DD-endopeptidase MepM/ murein hydrolase activator NlpD
MFNPIIATSMNRSLKYVLLAFGFFVTINYFFLAVQGFFRDLVLFPAHGDSSAMFAHPNYADGLTSVNFNLFNKGGAGWSYITQGYGRTAFASEYPGDWHDGIDIAAVYGAPVYSPNAGTVLATGDQDDYCYRRAFGKYVAVRDAGGKYVLWYAHLGTINVSPAENISAGTEIGTIGNTGLETGAHLHFSIFDASTFSMQSRDGCGPEPTGQDEDPIPYLRGL